MKSKEIYRPNYLLYFILIVLSVSIITASYLLPLTRVASSIINSISCGCFSSIIIALIIDIADCRTNRRNAILLKKAYFSRLILKYTSLLIAFWVHADRYGSQDVKRTWDDWALQYIEKWTEKKAQHIIPYIEDLEIELEQIKNQRLFLFSQHLISNREIIALAEVEENLKYFKMGLKGNNLTIIMAPDAIHKWHSCASTSELLNVFNGIKYNSIGEIASLEFRITL